MRDAVLRQESQGRQLMPRRNGSALIVVLWVVGILSLMIGSFAFDAHIEARITNYCRNRRKGEFLAKSGIEIAEMLMIKSRELAAVKARTLTAPEEPQEEKRWDDFAKSLSEGMGVRGLSEKLGDGVVSVDVVPEPSRRNINRLGDNDEEKKENLERLLDVAGVPEDLWNELVESFLDWTDADELARAYGAENEYYEALEDKPYRAKNGPLDTVEELLLVRGFERPVVEGGRLRMGEDDASGVNLSGVGDLLTTYGDGKVDVNAAPDRVLKTLPGVDEIMAAAIVEEREGLVDRDGKRQRSPFKSVDDFFMRVPGLPPAVRKWITIGSEVYRINSVGRVGGVAKKISCIVKYSAAAGRPGQGRGSMTILRWMEDN